MPTLTLGNQVRNVDSVVRLRVGNDWEARRATMSDGADNVTFRVGNATYIASQRGMRLDGVRTQTPVRFMGQQGVVTEIDDEVNTRREAIRDRWDQTMRNARNTAIAVTTGGGVIGTGTAIAGAVKTGGAGLGAVLATIGTGAATGLGIGVAAGTAIGAGVVAVQLGSAANRAARRPVNVHAVDIFAERRWTR
jgi:hypothetical protein